MRNLDVLYAYNSDFNLNLKKNWFYLIRYYWYITDTYDSDDRPALLTDDTSAHKIYVGARPRERRSLMTTRETASLEQEQDEREYERFAEQTVHRLDFSQKVDYDDR